MKALIINDDFLSATKVNASLKYSARNANFVVQWNIKPWRVELLKFPPAVGDALPEAIDAHLIVFVARDAQCPLYFQGFAAVVCATSALFR